MPPSTSQDQLSAKTEQTTTERAADDAVEADDALEADQAVEAAAAAEGQAAEAAEAEADDPGTGEAPDAPEPRTRRWQGWRERHPVAARRVAWTATGLSALLVFVALLLPNQLSLITPGRFAHIPVEAILLAGLLLVLPLKPRRAVAVAAGAVLGLLTILNCVDMGFYSVLGRPFYIVSDWVLFGDGLSWVKDSFGQTGAVGAVVGTVVLIVAILGLMVLAILRLSTVIVRHRATASRSVLVLGIVWMTCTTLGVQVAGAPLASRGATQHIQDRVNMVTEGLADKQAFLKAAADDPYAKTPGDQLLTGLRGKDVIFTFIESYGRSAVENSQMAPGVDKVLDNGTKQLEQAGFAAKSGWLTSPTYGAGSWLAHSTFGSGLWVTDQQRYRTLTSHQRLTLTGAFKKTGAWRTVGIMPGVTEAWPEGKFYGLDNVYDSKHMGYKGPKFSWTPVPDQFSLEAFQRLEHGKKHDKPLATEIILASSHAPWAPMAKITDWDKLGDGSLYYAQKKAGQNPTEVWKDDTKVRAAYGNAIQYSLTSIIQFLQRYGDKNTVMVFLGDHQPVAAASGTGANHQVPITIVAHDKSVLDKVASWNWTDGLKPASDAPVWKMDSFRNRFLTAFGPNGS